MEPTPKALWRGGAFMFLLGFVGVGVLYVAHDARNVWSLLSIVLLLQLGTLMIGLADSRREIQRLESMIEELQRCVPGAEAAAAADRTT
ncbi:MAG: hypothetical protein KY476_01425 [Planctomycetes bacterium]|nr:hypothetical protein [Planctomycetota bacterium]